MSFWEDFFAFAISFTIAILLCAIIFGGTLIVIEFIGAFWGICYGIITLSLTVAIINRID